MSYESRFHALKNLPPLPTVPANCNFVMSKIVGDQLILSGYGPIIGANIPDEYKGKLGEKISIETGYHAARLTSINLLLIVENVLGTLNDVEQIISVEGFVNSTNDFTDQPSVINGCSDLLVEIFGSNGRHTRSAIGTNTLAFDICVEISMTLQIRKC
jgi:enamine deaminase RidA (YjgF/YER057c/UK114 family)